MRDRISEEKTSPGLSFKMGGTGAAVGILWMAWWGWGWWGNGVAGDYSLDMADAIRLCLGQKPYCEFIPTYGGLSMLLLAPFFHLGSWALPAIWMATLLLVMLECFLVLHLIADRAPPSMFVFAALLFVATVAFIPSNSGYMMGYSASALISVALWTLFLAVVREQPCGNWKSSLLLGLQPFTKMDLGLLSIVVLLFMLLRCAANRRWGNACRTILIYILPSVFIFGTMWMMGARWELWWGYTAEALGQAGYVRDPILEKRLGCLFLAGGVAAWLMTLPHIQKWRDRVFPMGLLFLFAGAVVVDGIRIIGMRSPYGPIALSYFWALVWIAAAWSLAFRWKETQLLLMDEKLLFVILGGVGLFRCALSGWFPLNYYQPSFLLLFMGFLRGRDAWRSSTVKTMAWSGLVAAALTSFYFMIPGKSVVPFQTPYGWVRLESGGRWVEPIPIYERLRAAQGLRLFCTYMTGPYLLTGMEPSGLYTYWHRLSAAGKFREKREELALSLLQKNPPDLVLFEKERATFAPHFGKDFGLSIDQWIRHNYAEVAHFKNQQGGSWALFEKKAR